MLKPLSLQLGTTLVELMISMAIGFASLTAMASLVGHGIGLNTQLLAKSRLDEELNGIVELLINDIKRAGFDGNTSSIVSDPNTLVSPFAGSVVIANHPAESANSCLLFAYDRNKNGLLDTVNTNENYGYRLKDKAIEIRLDGLGCSINGWHDLSDPQVVKVTKLEFKLHNQQSGSVKAKRIELIVEAELKSNSAISKRVHTSFMIKNYG
ncbi:prepilin peptidase dependent protein B [Paraglaciecola hydrolytica]|uniref:Prepilin peptidase dependent protein B n=1 Tax=Paraglaciecola hydrolytica TaxID=1799789 RepID=A0A148KLR4_9ALTE|nr:prepilin peptidase dependent protein B [Paraglaciecola hydrolytica]KXI27188.1 prepilin peptidase dependent protein B [Paraglaciecola hydrolytica]